MAKIQVLAALVLTSMATVSGQRPFFAGTKPIGFPDTPDRTTTEGLGDRFGEGTTQRLPIEANGDRDLIDRLSKLPIDKQPFWFINWQAIETHREKPQTFPQKPNVFIDPLANTFIEDSTGGTSGSSVQSSDNNSGNSDGLNNNFGIPEPNFSFSTTAPVVPEVNKKPTTSASVPIVNNSENVISDSNTGNFKPLTGNSPSDVNASAANPAKEDTNKPSLGNRFDELNPEAGNVKPTESSANNVQEPAALSHDTVDCGKKPAKESDKPVQSIDKNTQIKNN